MASNYQFKKLIVFEDEDLLVINKPAGIASLHERSGEGESIIALARDWHPDLQLCHRIDKETSGALIISKNPETYRGISVLLEQRKVQKTYQALVWGIVPAHEFECDQPIAVGSRGVSRIDRKGGKESLTKFKLLSQYKNTAHILAQPVSGRLHQIRVHCAALEIPIMADTLYQGKLPYLYQFKKKYKVSDSSERPMISRLALHATSVAFVWREKQYEVEIPLPHDMEVLNKLLSKYDV
jgi:23S rRNA pseudouridine955/2504/2580 synthase